jgi:hypothetical protein
VRGSTFNFVAILQQEFSDQFQGFNEAVEGQLNKMSLAADKFAD